MVQLTSKTFDTVLQKILVNYIIDHYTAQKWLFGVVWESGRIFGPFFFEEGEETATVTSDRYIRMFENCFLSFADIMA